MTSGTMKVNCYWWWAQWEGKKEELSFMETALTYTTISLEQKFTPPKQWDSFFKLEEIPNKVYSLVGISSEEVRWFLACLISMATCNHHWTDAKTACKQRNHHLKLALAALSSNDFFEKVPIPQQPSRKTKRKQNRRVWTSSGHTPNSS